MNREGFDVMNLKYIGDDLLKVKHESFAVPRRLERLTLLNILHSLPQTGQVNEVLDLG